jgi:dihydrofolate synthase / folylpolyglutamate synthase
VITSISHDHVQILGNRLDLIAWEKAGIIKPGRPTISGATNPEARAVIEETCRQRHSPLRQLGIDFSYTYQPGQVTTTAFQLPVMQMTSRQRWPDFELKLQGEHQARNATLVVASVEQLRSAGLTISDASLARGLTQVDWPARLEVMRMSPLVILDCSHNVASILAVIQTLNTSFRGRRRILLFAASSDKDIPGMVRELAPQFQHAVLTRFTDSRRAMPLDQLAEQWCAVSTIPFSVHATPAEAWREAQRLAAPDDLICITGSIFLAGELRPLLLASA